MECVSVNVLAHTVLLFTCHVTPTGGSTDTTTGNANANTALEAEARAAFDKAIQGPSSGLGLRRVESSPEGNIGDMGSSNKGSRRRRNKEELDDFHIGVGKKEEL